jgi:peptide/nickel transport system permease protein
MGIRLMKRGLVRLAHALVVLAGASALVFLAGLAMPGDPAEVLLRQTTETPTVEQVNGLRRSLSLDQALPRRYLRWIGSALMGDLGRSWRSGEPVAHLVAKRIGATLSLALAAFTVIVLLGVTMGGLAVVSRARWSEAATRTFAILTASVPAFWLGTLLIELLGVRWAWFPFIGYGGIAHHFLPAITLGLGVGATQGRILRSVLRDLASQDFVRFAYAAGLTRRSVFLRRLLPNALPTIITLWGISFGQLLGGAFIVESIFSWPGLGRLTVDAVLSRDLPVIQGCILVVTMIFVVSTDLVRLAQDSLDPRLARQSATSGGGAH